MAKVKTIKYKRSIVPDNLQPEKSVRKYESETFETEIALEGNDSPEEAFRLAESTILAAHRALETKRDARGNIVYLRECVDEIDDKLDDDDGLYDMKKLRKRKAELLKLIAECE